MLTEIIPLLHLTQRFTYSPSMGEPKGSPMLSPSPNFFISEEHEGLVIKGIWFFPRGKEEMGAVKPVCLGGNIPLFRTLCQPDSPLQYNLSRGSRKAPPPVRSPLPVFLFQRYGGEFLHSGGKWGQSERQGILLLFFSTRHRVRKWRGDLALNLPEHFII
jgi:hypothetical protein